MQEYLATDHNWTVLTPEDLINVLEAATVARDLPGMADVDASLLAFCRQIKPYTGKPGGQIGKQCAANTANLLDL